MTPGEIIQVAAPRQAPGIPVERVLSSISQELNNPGTIAQQFGDTFFIAHLTARPDIAIFRALNADTPQNYIQNVFQFFAMMLKHGVRILIAEFKDPSLISIAKVMQRRIDDPNALQYAIQKTANGGFRITVLLGDSLFNYIGEKP